MEWKKKGFADQFPYCGSSPRRKIVSGFGLWALVTCVILTVFVFNISFRAAFLNPVFQGFHSFGSKNTSRSTGTPPSSSSSSSSDNDIFSTARLKESGDIQTNVNVTGSMEVVDLGALSKKGINGSFTSVRQKTQERNPSEIDEKGKSPGNSSEIVGNGNFSGGLDFISGKTVPRNKSSTVQSVVSTENQATSFDKINATILRSDFQSMERNSVPLEECDIFDGRWVRDDKKPYYPAGSCPFIDRDFDCHLNGRPDDAFLRWRWQPNSCDIPSLNATDFLERLRGKKLVFVGDSLNRNMWESLVCILRHSLKNKNRMFEISGKTEFKKKGVYAFRFEDYNCSVDLVFTPFLVRESSFNGGNGSLETLRLDLMDKTTSMYRDADILVFNTGHWWTHEKTSKGEDYYQEGNHVHPRLKVLEAYKRALATWGRWVDRNIDANRTQVLFRGYSLTHFRGGPWNSGGECHRETEPIFNETHLAKYPSKMRVLEHVLQEMKTPVLYLNISRLTDYRKDGHPSIYRHSPAEGQMRDQHSQDCSHWCLPGVPDIWNELLYASLLKARKGSLLEKLNK